MRCVDRLKSCQSEGGGVSLQCRTYLPKVGMRLRPRLERATVPSPSLILHASLPIQGPQDYEEDCALVLPPALLNYESLRSLDALVRSCGLCGLPEAGQGAERYACALQSGKGGGWQWWPCGTHRGLPLIFQLALDTSGREGRGD